MQTTSNHNNNNGIEDKMVCYLNYNHNIIDDYDSSRLPVGLQYLSDSLSQVKNEKSHGSKDLSISLLEIACGSGNYLARLATQVDKAYGIDMNQAMLAQCRTKLDQHQVQAELIQAQVPAIPFDDHQFDFICNCQMLHHLSGGLPTLKDFFREINRVLKNNGMVIVNFTTKEQIDSYWYMDLIPRAKQLCIDRCYTLDDVSSILTQVGLVVEDIYTIYDTLQQKEIYLDPTGPLSSSYRHGDSTWSKASEQELQYAEFKLKQMLKLKTAEKYVETRDEIRQKLGQSVMIRARAKHQ
ncbi:Malonyl-[acyl-carrier protein] O-methyltransferase [Trichoplax sp. H2]|uniref:Methyltransferase type 11 domain-containing protein n=1 Tax=Trichoplax adhaerens TaxID=10228 RepID=B3RP82_TRIAD|nr:hypothetical protein TRIADDRAFT_53437 [Trichoplax adhaerens]EDV28144.1 hypothetical protein TRIADDRAFT_53437 [Trichoplax adhaerens]RDD45403.1 Malonyl-[acyl-carrier protein] O-methyltransferase [Trichoplax sp. H2]|eukprot:XP_002109978.1 hypothetical protein TRIADDRAFT_53437 [Trichoplax adhaerens]